jgi:hypothetical protein
VRRPSQHPPFFWFALAAGGCAFASLAINFGIVLRHLGVAYDPGWKAVKRDAAFYLSSVDPNGPAAGKLQPGDRILAINADSRMEHVPPDLKLRFLPPDRQYFLILERHGSPLEIPLRFSRVPAGHSTPSAGYREFDMFPPLRGLRDLVLFSVVGLAFLGMGLTMALSKPDEAVTRLGFLAGASVSFQMLAQETLAIVTALRGWELTFVAVTTFMWNPLHFVLAYDFLSRFPSGEKPGGLWSFIRVTFYCYAFPEWLLMRAVQAFSNAREDVAVEAYTRFPALFEVWYGSTGVRNVMYAAISVAMVAVIIRNYRVVREPDQRRRLKWAMAGIFAGLTPLTVLSLAYSLPALHAIKSQSLNDLANFTIVVIPITLAYAIARHRVLGVSVVVRRGLQYLLARNALRAILLIPILVVALNIAVNPSRPVGEVLFRHSLAFYVFLGVTLALLRYRKQVSLALDRRFFREAYDQEHILLDLLDSVKEIDDMPAISRLVSERIEAALHPSTVLVFYRQSGAANLRLGYSSGGSEEERRIDSDRPIMRALETRTEPFTLSRDGGDLPPDEREWLAQLRVTLAVPIANSGRLDGVLMLGEKKSEEPYTKSDRNLLQAIAGQIAVVSDNLSLRERVARDQRVRTEVLAHLEEGQILLLKECPSCGACFDSTLDRCSNDGAELTLSLPIERTLDGKYRLDQLLGKGGMGAVYAAADLRLNRNVAVKVIVGRYFGNQNALRRFEREAQACARLSHPHIISIFDYGRIGDSGAFLVMELLEGHTLRQELKSRGMLDATTAANWFDQILEGIKAAHHAGVVHRDLKPENVLVIAGAQGNAMLKILDFGLAKLEAGETTESTALTAAGAVLGTIGYMSPEQLKGEAVDERADIFSLGVMIVEALTGARPFQGATQHELVRAILQGDWRLPGDSEEIRALDHALQRCLARDRDRRYRTIEEMQQAVIPAIRQILPFASVPESGPAGTNTI